MKRLLLALLVLLLASSVASAQGALKKRSSGEFSYLVRPSFTFLMGTEQSKDSEALVMTLLGRLRANVSFDLWDVHIKSYLNADFKREAYSDASPRNLKDDLIISVIPSVHLSEEYDISLFLELSMETDMAHGERDGIQTSFMDPAFFYETLYVGQWLEWKSDDKSQRLSMRYGVGYAFQQTLTSNFLLTEERRLNVDPDNPLSAIRKARSVKLESGYSGLLSIEYLNDITDDLKFSARTFGIALSKGDLGSFFENPHAVAEFETALTYKIFAFKYDVRLVYDTNYSARRQLDQTASFGIALEFKD
ncbi:MAG: hypothetical protein C0600_13345 [Ignavibacteria bacterium]|nr:MAG: hypothetical protein C0600_13345 [Ignavibacteria bacterium]